MHEYHYLYRITNQITGEYYYGVHSTNDLKDYYFGSGSKLYENIRQYGRENFIKENLEFFSSRKQLMNAEKNLVTNEMLADPKCLNVILGGGELKDSLGYKCVVNEDGEYMMVDKNNDEYQNYMISRICINKNGRMKYIKNTTEFFIEEPTVISLGKFDGIHRGHELLLEHLLKKKREGYATVIFTFSIPPKKIVDAEEVKVLTTNEEKIFVRNILYFGTGAACNRYGAYDQGEFWRIYDCRTCLHFASQGVRAFAVVFIWCGRVRNPSLAACCNRCGGGQI